MLSKCCQNECWWLPCIAPGAQAATLWSPWHGRRACFAATRSIWAGPTGRARCGRPWTACVRFGGCSKVVWLAGLGGRCATATLFPLRILRSNQSAFGLDLGAACCPLAACIGAGAQPYVLYISPAAEVSMDHHAHLSSNEIIGMLAGHFEPETRTIR